MVARPKRCGCPGGLGSVFIVRDVEGWADGGICTECGAWWELNRAPLVSRRGDFLSYEASRLKKINPPAQGRSVTRKEEVTA